MGLSLTHQLKNAVPAMMAKFYKAIHVCAKQDLGYLKPTNVSTAQLSMPISFRDTV